MFVKDEYGCATVSAHTGIYRVDNGPPLKAKGTSKEPTVLATF